MLLAEWGPDVLPAEQAFWACPPHRIRVCAEILRDSYEPVDLIMRWMAALAGDADSEYTLSEVAGKLGLPLTTVQREQAA